MDSSKLVTTSVSTPVEQDSFRTFYLAAPTLVEPPCIAASRLLPENLVEHLMKNKKDAAIGVKYVLGDAITNMEGALHSLLTPVAKTLMQGDYRYLGVHIVPPFESVQTQMARPVLLSCLVQPDFEFETVVYELIKHPLEGEPLPTDFTIPTSADKRDGKIRNAYDQSLKKHIVHHLLGDPPESAPEVTPASIVTPDRLLEQRLSLHLLEKIMTLQLTGEFLALTKLAPHGFVYTWDPPSIFARSLSPQILNQLWIKALVEAIKASTCKLVAFNDYADPTVLPALRACLDVPAVPKSSLFVDGLYRPGKYAGLALVIHNNSDGFGQNIQTEAAHGSLDGAIGAGSSGAASVLRERPDLCSDILWY